MTLLTLDLERRFWQQGMRHVVGVDEVGRGPLAGPVVAAAVILDPDRIPEGLNDSKKLTAKKRAALNNLIRQHTIFAIGEASVEEIDQVNILQASFLAMRRAIEALPLTPDHALIDGNRLPKDLPCPATPVVGGDGVSPSIAGPQLWPK
jgi:ribonuclease HII